MSLLLAAILATAPLALRPAHHGTTLPFPSPASPPSAEHARSATSADTLGDRLRRELGPWLGERAKNGAFSGVVLVARNGTPIYSAAFGMADRARKVANTIDTRFNIGSMNKMWTAIAIAQLIEQGKVDLDATVGRYISDLPNQSIRETVKVRHLLTHTSGMGSYFRKGFLRNQTYASTAADFVPFYADEPLSFTPGDRMQYSNSGFALLGLIVERVSGQSFYDYMKRNVIERAGMSRAAFVDLRSRPTDIAVGYTKPENGGGEDVPNWSLIEQHSSPAGGAYASATDLVAFSRALWSGKLVGRELTRQFTTGQVTMGPPTQQMQYAFGFGVGRLGRWRHVGHNGGAPGANAEFLMFPDQGIDVVVLANMDDPAATDVIRRVSNSIASVTPPVATEGGPQVVTVDVGPDGRERRSGNAPPGGLAGGPPATLPAGMPSDRLPDNVQGRRAAAFLEAFGTGTTAALESFLTEHAAPRSDRTVEERARGLLGIHDRTGKLTFVRLAGVRADQIRVEVLSAKDGPLTLFMFFEPAPPHRATLFNFEAGERER